MKKNLVLISFSIFFSILIIEIFLRVIGLYSDLAKITLEPSSSIYEKPKDTFQKHKHPDLRYIISNYFDLDGVKNNTDTMTSNKKNIIGIFGDSMVENYLVDPEFDFSNILNSSIINHQVVNYGVGGYQAEQVFLRYLKYKDHDLKYVFYFFMPGDQETLNLISFNDSGQFIVNKVKINKVFEILGRLNITYLSINSLLIIRSLIHDDFSSIKSINYPQLLANRIAKRQLNYGHSDMRHFANLIEIFQKTVESNNAKFFVILYPDKNHITYFHNALKLKDLKVSYIQLNDLLTTSSSDKKFTFINDSHWNEFGNLEFARELKSYFNKNLKINFVEDNDYNEIENKIKKFYSLHKKK